ncbi:MAG: ATP-binding protein [Candidatus Sumerlaeia bacterium]|nr:ATP-binding protein [Candidatus Sumerlaeia bacterium]
MEGFGSDVQHEAGGQNGSGRATGTAHQAAIATALGTVADWARVQRRQFEARTADEERQRRFFEHESEPLVTLSWEITSNDLLMVNRALTAHLMDWVELEPGSTKRELMPLVGQLAVEVAPDTWDFVPLDALRFWIGPADERLCVQISDMRAMDDRIDVAFVAPRRLHDFVRDLWPRLQEWITAHHYLRGQRFTADMHFLRLDADDAWEALVLPEAMRQTILANTVNLLRRREVYRAAGVPLRRGVLLHGPPGTGKTRIGRALAQSCGCTFILVTPAMIGRGVCVRALFELARRLAPTVLFFEDLDLVGGDRHSGCDLGVLGELLVGLDGLDSGEGIIAVATTNDLTAIEPALKDRPSRFDIVLEVPTLDAPERAVYLARWLAAHPGVELDTERLVAATRGFSGAQMQELCRAAIIAAIDRQPDDSPAAPVIRQQDFESALERLKRRHRPAVGFQVA